MKRLIIVPAYNEAKVIYQTLASLKNTLRHKKSFDILVVDDGSTDNTSREALKAKVKVIQHKLNRGLGGALGTGLAYARIHKYDLAVTFDADGQHDPRDIIIAVKPVEEKIADIVIGTRTRSNMGQMPLDRKIINWLSNIVTWVFFGIWTSDSQSGFRAFSKKALRVVEIKTEKMEVSSEIFAEIKKHHLRVSEVPIRVIYTEYSRSKGQDNLNAINVLYKLLLRLFRE